MEKKFRKNFSLPGCKKIGSLYLERGLKIRMLFEMCEIVKGWENYAHVTFFINVSFATCGEKFLPADHVRN